MSARSKRSTLFRLCSVGTRKAMLSRERRRKLNLLLRDAILAPPQFATLRVGEPGSARAPALIARELGLGA
jgi:hypothetical protein